MMLSDNIYLENYRYLVCLQVTTITDKELKNIICILVWDFINDHAPFTMHALHLQSHMVMDHNSIGY